MFLELPLGGMFVGSCGTGGGRCDCLCGCTDLPKDSGKIVSSAILHGQKSLRVQMDYLKSFP